MTNEIFLKFRSDFLEVYFFDFVSNIKLMHLLSRQIM